MLDSISETAKELGSNVFPKALELIDSREDCYSDRWKREPTRDLIGNASRKIAGLEYQIRKGLVTNKDKYMEDILDGINYLAFAYRIIQIKGSINGEE